MDDAITLSSGSDKGDSDVEIVGAYTESKPGSKPFVKGEWMDVAAVNVPPLLIDLTDPRWAIPGPRRRKRQNSTAAIEVLDLIDSNITNGTEKETKTLPPDDCEKKMGNADKNLNGNADKNLTSNRGGSNSLDNSSKDSTNVSPVQDYDAPKPKQEFNLDSVTETPHQKQPNKPNHCPRFVNVPFVKLRRLPLPEAHVRELKTSSYSVYLTKECKQLSLCLKKIHSSSVAPEYINSRTTTMSNGPQLNPSVDKSPEVVETPWKQGQIENREEQGCTQSSLDILSLPLQSPGNPHCSDKRNSKDCHTYEAERGDFCSSTLIPSLPSPRLPQDEAHSLRDLCFSNLSPPASDSGNKQLEFNPPESRLSPFSDRSSPHFPTAGLDPHIPQHFELNSQPCTSSPSHYHSLKSQDNPTPTSKDTLAGNTPVWELEEVEADLAMNSPAYLCNSIPSDPPLSVPRTEDLDEGSGTVTYRGDLGVDSPVHVDWQEGSDAEEANEESKFDGNFRSASREDRHFVCPITLRKIMAGPAQSLNDEEDDDGFGAPEVLCRQSLSLVYSTIEENYPEGTLQLLSDLLQPGYYPPRDITSHLLRGILLDPQCPQHLCVQAFNLLMRTQRHHMADKTTIPWDWELLSLVMANQDHAKRHRWEVVRMLLEYVVQTLEDDFQAKLSLSALRHSIAKQTLSCDLRFTQVRDVIKWLFAAIMKSTEYGDSGKAAKERDEHIRVVSVFQRMLSMALEVDRSPALSSAKLSEELFHTLVSIVPLRAHRPRMLLLESLQSKLLRCKLVEHLLGYACPQKTPMPMSLSLLLHFLKNCTLTPDPMDGAERWQRWEELVQLLWMLLLSYNKVMKGICYSQATCAARPLSDHAVSAPWSTSHKTWCPGPPSGKLWSPSCLDLRPTLAKPCPSMLKSPSPTYRITC
ncbi:SUMO-interacting motif-containing protein 1 isoform X2 [Centroberyx affinis]|uniref:SUMO-interacting motif-containing protein 1 isoform X2 n=1 Tax=Centroberyx affinis TaxID=166261 RepID=UPI003A5C4289